MTVWNCRCLNCGSRVTVNFSPFAESSCPQCGASSIHLQKVREAQM